MYSVGCKAMAVGSMSTSASSAWAQTVAWGSSSSSVETETRLTCIAGLLDRRRPAAVHPHPDRSVEDEGRQEGGYGRTKPGQLAPQGEGQAQQAATEGVHP